MAVRRYRRGFARRQELREQGEVHQAAYDALSLDEKIRRQVDGGHDGRQLGLLLKKRGMNDASLAAAAR